MHWHFTITHHDWSQNSQLVSIHIQASAEWMDRAWEFQSKGMAKIQEKIDSWNLSFLDDWSQNSQLVSIHVRAWAEWMDRAWEFQSTGMAKIQEKIHSWNLNFLDVKIKSSWVQNLKGHVSSVVKISLGVKLVVSFVFYHPLEVPPAGFIYCP